MKVNQIVSEHKKGVRAMKYTKKTKSTVPVYGPDAKTAKLKPIKPVGTVNESTEHAFHSWMNSEYSPMSDESGDDAAVFNKALHFAAQHLNNRSDSEYLAHKLAHMYHGSGDPDELDEEGEGTITKSDPTTGVEITDAGGVKTTLPPEKTGAVMPDPEKPGEYDMNLNAVAPGAGGAPAGPKLGSKVEIKTAESLDAIRALAGL